MLETPKAQDTSMVTIPEDITMDHQQAIDCAYIAGLMDGEGSFCYSRHVNKTGLIKLTPRMSMGITNQDVDLKLKYFCTKYGIAHYCMKRLYPEPYLPVYVIEIKRILHLKRFLELILPYMVGKKRQVELLLRFCLSRMTEDGNLVYRGASRISPGYPDWVHDSYLEMHVLNGGRRNKKFNTNPKASTRTAQLNRLNDCTSTCTGFEFTRKEDTVSPYVESISSQEVDSNIYKTEMIN